MALTPSTQVLELGTSAPGFSLPVCSTDEIVRLQDFAGKPLLVMFICNHCPYVIHIERALADFAREYERKGLAIVGISSNWVESHPADAPDKMAAKKKEVGYVFPYLFDETQEVARSYHAACTPDFFLFDRDHRLAYAGQFDETRPGKGVSHGGDLRRATDAVLRGETVSGEQLPSMGCNIKWKPGNAPMVG